MTYQIIGAAIEVHKQTGPGLLEAAYQKCLKKELQIRNLNYKAEHFVKFDYKGSEIDTKLRCDFLIEDAIVLELKSVEAMHPLYDAQLLTYMKLLSKPKGILINFNVVNIFQEGQKTLVNELYRELPTAHN